MAEWGATPFLRPNKDPKIRNSKIRVLFQIFQHQSIDNIPKSCHMKFELDYSKNGRFMVKKRMPIYGHMGQISSFMALILAKYQ